jgi:hypothetical protein
MTSWRHRQNRCRWREFEFIVHQIRKAVDPTLSLKQTLAHWPQISRRLAEAPRTRRDQLTLHQLKYP